MESNNIQQNTIESVLEKIKRNELKIKPKTYFTLRLVAVAVVMVLMLITSVFLFSFILFTIRASNHAALLDFGPSGLTVFFLLFPWKLLIIDLFLLVILEWLLRSFRFGYKVPVLYLFVGMCGVIIVCGYILDKTTPIHDQLLIQADKQVLPKPIIAMYQGVHTIPPPPPNSSDIVRGVVIAISTSTGTTTIQAIIDSPTGTTTKTFVLPMNAKILQDLRLGDRVLIKKNGEMGPSKAVRIEYKYLKTRQ